MFLTERKLDRRITEIREYCYREIRHLEEFAVCEDHQGVVNPEVPVEFEGWEKCVPETGGAEGTVISGSIRRSSFQKAGKGKER